jgi:hypothetical protein
VNERELLAAHDELVGDVWTYMIQSLYRSDLDMRTEHRRDARHSPGQIPGWLLPRLTAYAARIGYPVEYVPEVQGNDNTLGITNARVVSGKLHGYVALRSDLSPRSRSRTLCHELAHAEVHPALLTDSLLAFQAGIRKDPHPGESEEIVAETCAALVTRALGTGWGTFSLNYLADHAQAEKAPLVAARDEAVRRAGVILKAIA